MHPAPSVIFFTTASGMGYGMLALMGVLVPLGVLPNDPWFASVAVVLALGLVSAGLLASTFHLRHPERAWRALSQWRSSWLSREGVAAVLCYGPAILFGMVWVYGTGHGVILILLGLAVTVMASITVFSTAMIYASLKTIAQWHHGLVPPLYLMLALATGAVWLNALTTGFGMISPGLMLITLGALALSWLLKYFYWRAIDTTAPLSDIGTATGLGGLGTVRQFEAPHTEDNWVMREMGFMVARKHSRTVRQIVMLVGFSAPIVCLLAIMAGAGFAQLLVWLSVVFVSIGITAERWLFFAEARHVVGLYYGRN
jgi:DMSO reductase anchor subunit